MVLGSYYPAISPIVINRTRNARKPPFQTRARARMHACTHARTHTLTHSHSFLQNNGWTNFQWNRLICFWDSHRNSVWCVSVQNMLFVKHFIYAETVKFWHERKIFWIKSLILNFRGYIAEKCDSFFLWFTNPVRKEKKSMKKKNSPKLVKLLWD